MLIYQALGAFNLVRENLGINTTHMMAEFMNRNYENLPRDDVRRIPLRGAIGQLQDCSDESLEDLEKELGEMISRRGRGEEGGDADFALLNKLVGALGLGYSSNYIPQQALKQLRKALLIPEELSAWTHKYGADKGGRCRECGVEIYGGEVVTFTGDAVVCARCSPPLYVRCTHKHQLCESLVAFPKAASKAIHQADCGCSKNPPVEEKEKKGETGSEQPQEGAAVAQGGLFGGRLELRPTGPEVAIPPDWATLRTITLPAARGRMGPRVRGENPNVWQPMPPPPPLPEEPFPDEPFDLEDF